MYNVSRLKTLIENGWTIANRRAIISKIGKANFDEIINLAHSANIADSFQYSNALTYLEPANIQRTKNLLSAIINFLTSLISASYI